MIPLNYLSGAPQKFEQHNKLINDVVSIKTN
jgi:hypothetical protein